MYPTYLPIYFLLLSADPRNYRVGTASCNRRKITPGFDRHYIIIIIRIPSEHLPHPTPPLLPSDTARRPHDDPLDPVGKSQLYTTFDPANDV